MSRDWLLAGALGLLALVLNLGAVATSPFHPDETRWLNRAHYLRDVRDPRGPTWADGYLTRGQPPLGSYLMGIGLTLQGRDLVTNGVWDFHHGAAWNEARGNMADPADLRAGRRTNAVVGAVAVVLASLTVMAVTNRIGGAVAGVVLATHPLMIHLSSQALADALLVALVAGAALAATRCVTGAGWGGVLALGALLGLGGATKLSPLLISLPVAAVGLALWWQAAARAPAARRRYLRLLIVPVVAVAVFVAVSPHLWPDPVGRTQALFAFRVEEMARQGMNWPAVAVPGRGEALARIWQRLTGEFSMSGQLAGWLRGSDLVLGALGITLWLAHGLRQWRAAWLAPAVVLISQAGLVVLGLRADYARYHLPVVLLMACGVGVVGGLGWAAVMARQFGAARPDARLKPRAEHREVLPGLRTDGRLPMKGAFGVGNSRVVRGDRRPLAALLAVCVVLLGLGAAVTTQAPRRGALAAQASPLAEASPVAATPVDQATPLAATPVSGATPMSGATPVSGATPLAVASPVASASPVAVLALPRAAGD